MGREERGRRGGGGGKHTAARARPPLKASSASSSSPTKRGGVCVERVLVLWETDGEKMKTVDQKRGGNDRQAISF